MKKILNDFSPIIAVVLLVVVLFGLSIAGVFGSDDSFSINSSTLTEMVASSKLSTAEYIHNGIAKAIVEGEDYVYINYKAVVRLNVDFNDITYAIDDKAKTVTPVFPEDYGFDVDLRENLEDFNFYPDDSDIDARDIYYICETDAKEKAENNEALRTIAKANLLRTISALLDPLLDANGYSLVIE